MKFSIARILFTALILTALLVACTATSTEQPVTHPTYDPFMPLNGAPQTNSNGTIVANYTPYPTDAPFIVPTAVALDRLVPPLRMAGQPFLSPTPDAPHTLPTPRGNAEEYVVQPGDTLGGIADLYGIGLDALMQANGLTEADVLSVGQTLIIPVAKPEEVASAFKVIPDSELVYGPASVKFDVATFIQQKGGFLAGYGEQIGNDYFNAAQIVTRVSESYSVNPRLLLALIEYRSGWVTNPTPGQTDFALGIAESARYGLYHQITYAANQLNQGYYLWRVNGVSAWVLTDGTVAPADARINAGTAGVQNLFDKLDDRATWTNDVGASGLIQTYLQLFGQQPFDYAVEPLIPLGLSQPRMTLPFERGIPWVFTGGPHGGWDSGSAWAALDFSPVVEDSGCFTTDAWVTALTDGLIVRTGDGQVLQDLDGDGYEQTGWNVLYMHVETRDRVEPGTYVHAGDRIGHPSCEGGLSNATHLHLARKYNGEWIPADGALPFILDGWVSSGTGNEYDGYLTRNNVTLEALESISDQNTIIR